MMEGGCKGVPNVKVTKLPMVVFLHQPHRSSRTFDVEYLHAL